MGHEVELKLALLPEYAEQLIAQELLERCGAAEFRQTRLENIYFDTPERALARHKVALRIRRDGDQYIQTLKTAGSGEAGLSVRNEWEWPRAEATLDTTLLLPHLPEPLRDEAVLARLAPLFATDFERRLCWLRGEDERGQWAVEVALDRGEIRAGAAVESICELEFELKQGTPGVLFDVALELARQLPLQALDISKAQRAYRLLDRLNGQPAVQQRVEPVYEADAVHTLLTLLQDTQRAWPAQLQAAQRGDATALTELKRTLDLLLVALQGLPDVAEHCGVLISQYQRLRESVAAAHDWRLLDGMPAHWLQAQQALGEERLLQLRHKTLPGQLALATGQLLWQIRDEDD